MARDEGTNRWPSLVDEHVRRSIIELVDRVIVRLSGRAAMNERTAASHPDPEVRARAAGRAEGYRIAAAELQAVAARPAPQGGPVAPDWAEKLLGSPPRRSDAPTGPVAAPADDRKALFEQPPEPTYRGRYVGESEAAYEIRCALRDSKLKRGG